MNEEKEKSDDNDVQLPLNREIRMEERTLFDDYYIAAIQGVAMGISALKIESNNDVQIAARVLAFSARELAVEAIKNRALYLYGEYKE